MSRITYRLLLALFTGVYVPLEYPVTFVIVSAPLPASIVVALSFVLSFISITSSPLPVLRYAPLEPLKIVLFPSPASILALAPLRLIKSSPLPASTVVLLPSLVIKPLPFPVLILTFAAPTLTLSAKLSLPA